MVFKTDTRQVDKKGRLTLDKRFAGRTVIVREQGETELVVTLARVIPEREAWLYENPAALESIKRGIDQARQLQFVEHPPDPAADSELLKQMDDEAGE